jgi:hypothetical protein
MLRPVPGRGAVADQIVIAVPEQLKSLVAPVRDLIAAVESRVRAGRGGEAMDYAAVEQEIGEKAASLERASHECVLGGLEVDAARVEIRGEEYVRVGHANGTYYTMTGPVRVGRALYRRVGSRNAKVVDAISIRAGTIGDGWLPRSARAMAHLHQSGTSREAAQTAAETGRLPYSRASFERVPHEVGALYLDHHADIEDQLSVEQRIPDQARSVSISLDRVSLPMEEPRPRAPGRPRKNAPKRPITRQFRMAYCGTVTVHDELGDALHTIRFGAMPDRDPRALCDGMANEVYRLREKRPGLNIALLADGAPEMWNLLETSLPEEVFGHRHRCIDFWHLAEKLEPAAKAIHGEHDAKPVTKRWRVLLKRRTDAAHTILAELEDSGCEHVVANSERPVHEAITYLRSHAERMNYAGALRKNLPIGSGNVEATCKTLVAVRMKRAGARWKTDTGEHVIVLRALALSDRWDGAMRQLLATQRAAVRTRAA